MSETYQNYGDTVIPDTMFADNTNQRTPCAIVVDGSDSMNENGKIHQLNAGLKTLENALKADPSASSRVQLFVARLGDNDAVEVLTDWTDAANFTAPHVRANGRTPLGAAVNLALSKIEEQKAVYRNAGIPYTRPWLFIISDGQPNDIGWEHAADRCQQAAADKKVIPWPVGVDGADFHALSRFAAPGKTAFELTGANFEAMFQWLSVSLSQVTQSRPGATLQLPAPPMVNVSV